jgi:hypothetical protein
MTLYALLLVTIVAPALVFALGRVGAWWALALIALLFVTHALEIALTRRRTLRAYDRGRCTRCGYDTRANAGRCPECGDELRAQAAHYWRSRFG